MVRQPETIRVPPAGSTITPTPFQPVRPTPTPTLPPVPAFWVDPAVPEGLARVLNQIGYIPTDDPQQASLRISLATDAPANDIAITWVYAVVAAFPSLTEDLTASDIQQAWRGEPAGTMAGKRMLVSTSAREIFSALWGPPAESVVSLAVGDWVEALWRDRSLVALVPFEELRPDLKTFSVDGQSPLRNDFDPGSYPLMVRFDLSCSGDCPSLANLDRVRTNRDPARLTTMVMTGVTALVRATAARMERSGVTFPGKDIRDWLRGADIAHISNEVPFAPGCPFPSGIQEELIFCSDPRYIGLLEDIGTDVIELTGNHANDWGPEAFRYTLGLYRDRGWGYFGGGEDLNESRAALKIEHNGNRLAFIGCNPVGPTGAWATDFSPGTAPCGDYGWMESEISRLRAEGYLPIATFQYFEYYQSQPTANQMAHFRRMADAGAVIVSGSQAHFPQTMEFRSGSFIHYGLGNLFFDQMDFPVIGTRREFLDRHTFYDGRYIGTELMTAMLEDYARPRPMNRSERNEFLQYIFRESGW